tara:strand:+ start:1191 stop:1556 length:366 start_codon:yes stop_codon:yes gene_type:complete
MALPTKRVLAIGILLLLVCQFSVISSVRAEVSVSEVSEEGAEIGAFFANLFYTPAKIAYALLGGVAGGAAYVLTGADGITACRIWTVSIRGTYALTPAHLSGEKPIRFAGIPAQTDVERER